MSVRERLTDEEIRKTFKKYGMFGLCPVYVNLDNPDDLIMQERNWVPEWWLWFNSWLQGCMIFGLSLLIRDYEPQWWCKITGDIK